VRIAISEPALGQDRLRRLDALSLEARRAPESVSGCPPGRTSVSARSAWTALVESGCEMEQGLKDPASPR